MHEQILNLFFVYGFTSVNIQSIYIHFPFEPYPKFFFH